MIIFFFIIHYKIKNLYKEILIIKLNHITSLIFSLLASWVIFAATPFFKLNGMYPQVDTQIIFLHSICGLMFFYLSGKLLLDKYELKNLDHPLIIIPFSLALLGSFI